MNLDLPMRPSKLFDKTFKWTCKEGLT